MSAASNNYETNMARLTGWVEGTVKELKWHAHRNPDAVIKECDKLLETVELVWRARYDRVVPFEEYRRKLETVEG